MTKICMLSFFMYCAAAKPRFFYSDFGPEPKFQLYATSPNYLLRSESDGKLDSIHFLGIAAPAKDNGISGRMRVARLDDVLGRGQAVSVRREKGIKGRGAGPVPICGSRSTCLLSPLA
jgi:hypothetical protein